MSVARRLAAEVLVRVEQGGAFANLALDSALRSAGRIEARETALATALTYGVLRWQIELDRAIAAYSDHPPEKLETPVRVALRLGAFELLHHPTVPARAAVYEAVECAKELRAARAAGLVNAVLRKLAETRVPPPPPPRDTDPIGHLAALAAHPRWMVERWAKWLGIDEAGKLCAANQEQAPAVVRVNRRRATLAEAQAALGIESRPGRFAPDALILGPGSPPAPDMDAHGRGIVQAQDEAAQLVSVYAAPGEGSAVLDACAAPGGKACHLAEIVGPGGSVLAVDLHERKARMIEEAAARLGHGNVRTLAADATLPIPGAGSFPLVLLDAPCSGLGTVRRHPEVKLRRTPADVDRLAVLQAKLLASLASYVAPGGLLVYAVCTLTPEECDEQVALFLVEHPGFALDAPPPGFPRECLDERGHLRTLPHRTGTDGFFAARLRRG